MVNTVAVLVVLATFVGARGLRRRRAQSGASSVSDPGRELSIAAMHIARAVRDGSSLPEALVEVSCELHGQVGSDLAAVSAAVQRGTSTDAALGSWYAGVQRDRHRSGSGYPRADDVALMVAAARFGASQGGDLPAALEGVSVALLDRVEVIEESMAMTSQARASAAVLVVLPMAGVVLFSLLDPRLVTMLFTTPVGLACVAAAVGLDLAAWVVSRRMLSNAINR